MIKVLLCSEGVHDSGREGQEGVLQKFMKKCVDCIDFAFECVPSSTIKKGAGFHKGRAKNTNKGLYLLQLADKNDCTHIAYHRDEDNKGLVEMREQVEGYFTLAETSGKKYIAIVPQHMTESWLLSDENAYPAKPTTPALPKKPEEIWGAPESSTHPKRYIADVLAQFNQNSNAVTFAEIAERTDIEVLKTRCPKSFGRYFYLDMQKFVNGE